MNWRQVFLLYKKELLEFLRDRRTFLFMIFVPALLYPGLILVTSELTAKQMKQQAERSYSVGLSSAFENSAIADKLENDSHLKLHYAEETSLDQVDIFVEPAEDYQDRLNAMEPAAVRLLYRSTSDNSRYAFNKVKKLLREMEDELLEKRLDRLGLHGDQLNPLFFKIDKIDGEAESRFLAGRILPGIMLIMLVVGCSFIAQEIAAGEKERGTLETILCSPLSRLELVCGKYLTVASVGLFSALINLSCMSLTLAHMSTLLPDGSQSPFEGFSIPLATTPVIFLCLLMVAFLISGMTLIAASLARTVQEAAQYMIPITLLLSLPVIISSLPGMEMEGSVRFIPFLNFCLLFQGLLVGSASLTDILAVLSSTGLVTLLAVCALIKIYKSEDCLFNQEGHSSLSFKRNKLKEKAFPETSDSFICFLVVLPLMFFVMTSIQKTDFALSVLVSQWGLLCTGSIVFLYTFKICPRKSLYLAAPGTRNLLCCTILAPACFIAAILLNLLLQQFGYKGVQGEEMDLLLQGLNDKYGLAGILFLVALTPAVCEEVFFRGVLLSGLRRKYELKTCMLLQALMFGAAHYSVFRFASTALMGALLTLVIFRTASIWCSMLIHFLFNGTSCLLWYFQLEESAFEGWLPYLITAAAIGLSFFKFLKIPENTTKEITS
jgi:sodium transport system permease protein